MRLLARQINSFPKYYCYTSRFLSGKPPPPVPLFLSKNLMNFVKLKLKQLKPPPLGTWFKTFLGWPNFDFSWGRDKLFKKPNLLQKNQNYDKNTNLHQKNQTYSKKTKIMTKIQTYTKKPNLLQKNRSQSWLNTKLKKINLN